MFPRVCAHSYKNQFHNYLCIYVYNIKYIRNNQYIEYIEKYLYNYNMLLYVHVSVSMTAYARHCFSWTICGLLKKNIRQLKPQ